MVAGLEKRFFDGFAREILIALHDDSGVAFR
jgi:hypothetical protein